MSFFLLELVQCSEVDDLVFFHYKWLIHSMACTNLVDSSDVKDRAARAIYGRSIYISVFGRTSIHLIISFSDSEMASICCNRSIRLNFDRDIILEKRLYPLHCALDCSSASYLRRSVRDSSLGSRRSNWGISKYNYSQSLFVCSRYQMETMSTYIPVGLLLKTIWEIYRSYRSKKEDQTEISIDPISSICLSAPVLQRNVHSRQSLDLIMWFLSWKFRTGWYQAWERRTTWHNRWMQMSYAGLLWYILDSPKSASFFATALSAFEMWICIKKTETTDHW